MKCFLSSPLLLFLMLVLLSTAVSSIDEDTMFVYKPETTTASAAIEKDCLGIVEVCQKAKDPFDPEYNDLKSGCTLLKVGNFLESSSLGSSTQFTIFLPTNSAVNRWFVDILGDNEIPTNVVRYVMSSHIIEEQKLDTKDIICKNRKKLDVLNSERPKLECETDIAGNAVTYIKGDRNRRRNYYPRFVNASNPIITCKDNIFLIDDVILS